MQIGFFHPVDDQKSENFKMLKFIVYKWKPTDIDLGQALAHSCRLQAREIPCLLQHQTKQSQIMPQMTVGHDWSIIIHIPFKIFRIVPLGLFHMNFKPNSFTRASSTVPSQNPIHIIHNIRGKQFYSQFELKAIITHQE